MAVFSVPVYNPETGTIEDTGIVDVDCTARSVIMTVARKLYAYETVAIPHDVWDQIVEAVGRDRYPLTEAETLALDTDTPTEAMDHPSVERGRE